MQFVVLHWHLDNNLSTIISLWLKVQASNKASSEQKHVIVVQGILGGCFSFLVAYYLGYSTQFYGYIYVDNLAVS